MSFLAPYYDPELDIEGFTAASITAVEIVRIQRQAAVVLSAMEIPRRLGGDATGDELALDKRRARRVLHVLKQSLDCWANGIVPTAFSPDEAVAREGAQLNWEDWGVEAVDHLVKLRVLIATYGMKRPDMSWAKRSGTWVNNELNQIPYALRED